VGANPTLNDPPEKVTTVGAPITRQPAAAVNGPTACMEHDPASGSPAGSLIVPVTVVVWANAGTQSASNRQIRISFSVIQINDGLATSTGSGSGHPNKQRWS
jgi:hypothetical protein